MFICLLGVVVLCYSKCYVVGLLGLRCQMILVQSAHRSSQQAEGLALQIHALQPVSARGKGSKSRPGRICKDELLVMMTKKR